MPPPRSSPPKLDIQQVQRYALATRTHKVSTESFGSPLPAATSGQAFLGALPDFLGALNLKQIVAHARRVREQGKRGVLAMGGHIVKTGVGPHIIRLMEQGYVTNLALNGAFAIHDFEIALTGKTSEAVDDALGTGTFGFAQETGCEFNRALAAGASRELGYGAAIAHWIAEQNFPYHAKSVMAAAIRLGVGITCHSTIGAEIIYQHPECDGAIIGRMLLDDFRAVTEVVADLSGGMWINIGSAVMLPEIFLKAVSIAINLGHDPRDFITVNMDMIQHYRPDQNVVRRPVHGRGRGYHLLGQHEILVPLLAWLLADAQITALP